MASKSDVSGADNTMVPRKNLSFTFSKLASKKLMPNKLQEDVQKREIILGVEGKKIQSATPKEEKKELIIPLIRRNNWRLPGSKYSQKKHADGSNNGSDELSDMAVKELLQESARDNEKWENRESSNFTITIPMVMQNKIPEGFETDDKLDTALRAEESTIDDYEDIPIDGFGVAMLKGMGCQPGDPIGNKNKQFVKPMTAVKRAKGLGLGADAKVPDKPVNASNKEELKLKSGAYVCILDGSKKGSYGVVEGIDESRVILKLENMKKNISLPFLYVEVVSKNDYAKESKVLNRSTYEKYKSEQESRNEHDSESRSKSRSNRNSSHRERDSPEAKYSKENCLPLIDSSARSHKSTASSDRELKRKHITEKKHGHRSEEKRSKRSWVCPDLRVRFIDEGYKKGKYFNQKMTVEDVVSFDSCICRTDDGKCLEDVLPSSLETVVPRNLKSYVMILDGKYRRQLAAVLERDKASCTATVQLLSDREKVAKLSYDSICEFVGDVSQFD